MNNGPCFSKTKVNKDYYPFGMVMPGRSNSSSAYRFGFNGKENDNEVKGTGNEQDYGMRIYDTRLGKFLSIDPLFREYPWNSTYAFAENDVIRSVDLDGLEKAVIIGKTNKSGSVSSMTIELPTAGKLGQGTLYVFKTPNTINYTYTGTAEVQDKKPPLGFWGRMGRNISDLLSSGDDVSNGGGGVNFTTSAPYGSQGGERQGYGEDPQSESIDLLLTTANTSKSAAESDGLFNRVAGSDNLIGTLNDITERAAFIQQAAENAINIKEGVENVINDLDSSEKPSSKKPDSIKCSIGPHWVPIRDSAIHYTDKNSPVK